MEEQSHSDSVVLHARVLETDQPWWHKEVISSSDQKLSSFTLNKLDAKGREFLKKYGSLKTPEGLLCEGTVDVGEYLIYLGQYLGYGDAGAVYLSQDKSTGEFLAAKSGAYGINAPDFERYNLAALRRLRAIASHNRANYYIQMLVDGIDFSSHVRIIPFSQQTEEQRILICYNFLKELEYLCHCGVTQEDIGCHNTMIAENGHVFFVDFNSAGTPPNNGELKPINSDEFKIQKPYVSMLAGLWQGVKSHKTSSYYPFVEKILKKKPMLLGELLKMLSKLMQENAHSMIVIVKRPL